MLKYLPGVFIIYFSTNNQTGNSYITMACMPLQLTDQIALYGQVYIRRCMCNGRRFQIILTNCAATHHTNQLLHIGVNNVCC